LFFLVVAVLVVVAVSLGAAASLFRPWVGWSAKGSAPV